MANLVKSTMITTAAAPTAPPPHTAHARIKAIQLQLDRAALEYTDAQKEFEVARINFQAARERFAGIKRMAHDALGHGAWFDWQDEHENVRYAAMPIGEAIRQALTNNAFESAEEATENPTRKFSPGMAIEEIAEVLESGGFEFQTTGHLREVNAALMRLKGTKRNKTTGDYEAADAAEILEIVKTP